MNWLEEIEARWAKATPGPWHWYHWKGIIEVQRKDAGEGDACPVVHWQGFDGSCRPVAEHNRNASAIAHAPEDVARLCAEVKALRAQAAADAEVREAARNAMIAADEYMRPDPATHVPFSLRYRRFESAMNLLRGQVSDAALAARKGE
jgi:hypothetical protein